MKIIKLIQVFSVLAALGPGLSLPAQAELIVNGGFESGFAGWTRADQLGSDGTFFMQSGTASPINVFPVSAPPEGLNAAMTDAGAGGAHVLYQDFIVPVGFGSASASFSLFLNNGALDIVSGNALYYSPNTLDWSGTALNQQARVDIIATSADIFSVAAGDVLQNLFLTNPGDPAVSGYNEYLIDVTALLQAHPGETLRLRFAETDNVGPFNLGVDKVGITTVDEPPTLMAMLGGLPGLAWWRRRSGKS